jgi:hypothetical protein
MNTRREFLQKLSGSAIGLSLLPGHLPAACTGIPGEAYDGPVLRVAIMGLGGYGTRVAEAMVSCKRAKLTGVISGTPSKIAAWQTKYNIPAKNCDHAECTSP